MFHASRHRDNLSFALVHDLAIEDHLDAPSDHKECLVLLAMTMSRTGLPVEDEQELAAVPLIDFVGHPELDQPLPVKIVKPEVKHQGLDIRHRKAPFGDLHPATGQRFTAAPAG